MPDRATVHVDIEGEGDSRESAYEAATAAANAVDAVLEAAGDALDRVTTAALLVQPTTRWKKGEMVRTGWHAVRTSVVEVRDLTRVGDLLARIAVAGGAISGPAWALDPEHVAYDEARQRAAVDARRRADAYAAALGLTITGVAWVSEPGLRLAGSSHAGPMLMAAAAPGAARMGEAPDDQIDITPEELTIRAVVEVGFATAD